MLIRQASLAALLFGLSIALSPAEVAAAESWTRPWTSTAGVVALDLAPFALPQPLSGSGWRNPLDDSARELMRGDDMDSRIRSRVISDLTLTLSIAAPLSNAFFANFQDPGTRPSRNDREWLGFTAIQSFSSTWAIVETIKRLAGRARPRLSDCAQSVDPDCANPSSDTFKSFPSGHTAFAFASAGLLCLQSKQIQSGKLPIGGDAACATGLGVATLTGFLRVQGDEHWLTDVAAGSLIGLTSSLLIAPLLSGSAPSMTHETQGGDSGLNAPPLFFASIPF